MKKLALALMLCCMGTVAHSDEPMTISQWVSITEKTAPEMIYIYAPERCAGLFNVMYSMTKNDKKTSDKSQGFADLADKFFYVSMTARMERNIPGSEKETGDKVGESMLAHFKFYMERMNNNFIREGSNFSNDPLIQEDLDSCVQLARAINKSMAEDKN